MLSAISVAVAAAGILVGFLVYGSGKIDWLSLRTRMGGLQRFLSKGWRFDDVFAAVLVAPGKAIAAFLAYVFDRRFVDGMVNGVGVLLQRLASVGRRVQTGLVRNYALAFLLGAVVIFVFVGLKF